MASVNAMQTFEYLFLVGHIIDFLALLFWNPVRIEKNLMTFFGWHPTKLNFAWWVVCEE